MVLEEEEQLQVLEELKQVEVELVSLQDHQVVLLLVQDLREHHLDQEVLKLLEKDLVLVLDFDLRLIYDILRKR